LPIILHSRADIDLDIEPEKYVAFDFDRGMTFNVERIINKKAPEGGMDLALKSGIDVIAVMSPNSAGLLGVAAVFEKLDRKTWESVVPGDLSIVADKQWRIDREQEIPAPDGQTSHPVYAFKTAQGGMGIVQLLQIDKVNRTVKLRYAMLSDGSRERMPPQPRAESARLLKEIGLAMAMYANDHEDKFPATLEQLREFMEIAKQGDPQWMTANVTYLAAGKTAGTAQRHLVAAAYDKTLLQQDSGTNVLFLDSHVEFIAAGELKRRGIAASDAAPPSPPGVERDVARPRGPVTPAEE
ncbi:MAG: hypothetical protein JXN61_13410, partial [Sedimentisphaerales bacterium]|nr:hypothetical protein [Sedimentisphaerales bacterium]